MFHFFKKDNSWQEEERARLNDLSEKELMIEILIELEKVNDNCEDIARKIIIWSN